MCDLIRCEDCGVDTHVDYVHEVFHYDIDGDDKVVCAICRDDYHDDGHPRGLCYSCGEAIDLDWPDAKMCTACAA